MSFSLFSRSLTLDRWLLKHVANAMKTKEKFHFIRFVHDVFQSWFLSPDVEDNLQHFVICWCEDFNVAIGESIRRPRTSWTIISTNPTPTRFTADLDAKIKANRSSSNQNHSQTTRELKWKPLWTLACGGKNSSNIKFLMTTMVLIDIPRDIARTNNTNLAITSDEICTLFNCWII